MCQEPSGQRAGSLCSHAVLQRQGSHARGRRAAPARVVSPPRPDGQPGGPEARRPAGGAEGSEYFNLVRATAVVELYDNPLVWKAFGYDGPSVHLGGYVSRGCDDLDWLPNPPIHDHPNDLAMRERMARGRGALWIRRSAQDDPHAAVPGNPQDTQVPRSQLPWRRRQSRVAARIVVRRRKIGLTAANRGKRLGSSGQRNVVGVKGRVAE